MIYHHCKLNNLESYIRGLESLGKKEDTYCDLLVHLILEKLPWNVQKSMARDHDENETWTLKDIRKGIIKEIHTIQAGAMYMEDSQPLIQSDFHVQTTAQALHTNAETTKSTGIQMQIL